MAQAQRDDLARDLGLAAVAAEQAQVQRARIDDGDAPLGDGAGVARTR